MRDFAVRAVRHHSNVLNINKTGGRQADDKWHLADGKRGFADGGTGGQRGR
jgi:hypothetical protein